MSQFGYPRHPLCQCLTGVHDSGVGAALRRVGLMLNITSGMTALAASDIARSPL